MANLIHRLTDDELVEWYTSSQSEEMLEYVFNEMILRGLA
jgi:hypothetical protein